MAAPILRRRVPLALEPQEQLGTAAWRLDDLVACQVHERGHLPSRSGKCSRVPRPSGVASKYQRDFAMNSRSPFVQMLQKASPENCVDDRFRELVWVHVYKRLGRS